MSASAPATQPTHSSMFRRTAGGSSPCTTTSETAKRPPGLSTRKASASTCFLSAERLITQFDMITSTRRVRQRDMLDLAAEEFGVRHAGGALILACERQHLVGHVEAVRLAGGAHAPRGEEHVDAAARAEIQDGLAGMQLGERGGISAAERGEHGALGQLIGLAAGVEVGGDRIGRPTAARPAAARRRVSLLSAERRFAVLLLHRRLDVLVGHVHQQHLTGRARPLRRGRKASTASSASPSVSVQSV